MTLWTPQPSLFVKLRDTMAAELLSAPVPIAHPITLHPHQEPPPGDWRVWLLMAGRGAGKTQAGAAWLLSQCQEGVYLGIVAPTFADARDTCIEGPAGILKTAERMGISITAYNRSMGEVQVNGARIKLYSGDQPDRLRGPQHHALWFDEMCFVAGTMITTDRGEVPIEQVQPGMLVYTRQGLRRVTVARMTQPAACVYELRTTDGRVLVGTGNHPVWTRKNGFIALQNVRPSDILTTCRIYQKTSSQALHGTDGAGGSTAGIIATVAANYYIALFMLLHMALSRLDTKFTTKTAIRRIIALITWLHSRRQIIVAHIAPAGRSGARLNEVKPRSSNGKSVSRGRQHARAVASSLQPAHNTSTSVLLHVKHDITDEHSALHSIARTVARLLKLHLSILQASCDSVHKHVRTAILQRSALSRAKIAALINRASSVARYFTHTIRAQNAAHVHVDIYGETNVASVQPLNTPRPVYNLEVEDCHEYFANGILVHNCAFRYGQEAFDMAMMGLRLGDNPRVIVTTTPRPTPLIRKLLADPSTATVRASTYANRDHLAPAFFDQIIAKYEGTRLGRQELNAELLDDVEGALWKREWITYHTGPLPSFVRVVVGIDPSATSTGDEAGVITAGLGTDGHAYILSDDSVQAAPEQWAAAAVTAYHKYHADCLLAEQNNGGEMVRVTISTIRGAPPVKLVHASRGKATRAEPVAMLYEQCIAEGTLIETARGQVPIEQVTTDDHVWTRKGLRRVLWSGQTGVKPTLRIIAGDTELHCTAEHPVFTINRGFVRADTLAAKCDIIAVWTQSLAWTAIPPFPSLEDDAVLVLPGIAGLHRANQNVRLWSSTTSATSSRLMAIGELVHTTAINSCTAPYGKQRTGQYQTVATSTTSTATKAIIGLKTSLCSLPLNIADTMPENCILMSSAPLSHEENWIGGNNASQRFTLVKNVDVPSRQLQREFASVLRPVTRATGISAVQTAKTVPVYNLEVEDTPEYFAAGVLVHNCKVHHVGAFPKLEDELCSWTPGDASPNRLDALVWVCTELLLGTSEGIYF